MKGRSHRDQDWEPDPLQDYDPDDLLTPEQERAAFLVAADPIGSAAQIVALKQVLADLAEAAEYAVGFVTGQHTLVDGKYKTAAGLMRLVAEARKLL